MFDLSLFPLAVCLSFFIHKSLFVWSAVHRDFVSFCLLAFLPLCLCVLVVQKITNKERLEKVVPAAKLALCLDHPSLGGAGGGSNFIE
jgi:hypothetical protein